MSIQRCATPVTASSNAVFRFAFGPRPRTCPHAARNFTSSMSIRLSSKRKLMTAPAYRPETLEPPPPPPRNTGVPNTSIAGGASHFNHVRPRLSYPEQDTVPPSTREQLSGSMTEEEAQKSKPVPEMIQEVSPLEAPKPKRKLRPRKAAMTLTPTAIAHLREMLEQPEPKLIRVGVRNRGCSGLAYHLEFVEKPGAFDEAVEQGGVKVLIDSKALFSIIGSEMDWVEDKLNQRFIFRNPNIKEQCGCGESFMV